MKTSKGPPFNPAPRFHVPYDEVGVYAFHGLQQSKLLALFELNRQDFIDMVGILYFVVISEPDRGQNADMEKGFASFCDLLKKAALAAPSQFLKKCVDPLNGLKVAFVGAAILEHLSNHKLRIQDLYSQNGRREHAVAWELIDDFVLYIAIEGFKSGISAWTGQEFADAAGRWMQLQKGERTLKAVGPESHFKK